METAKVALSIYTWIVIGLLVAFLWRIAYFYEKASGERLRHYLLVVPGLLLAAAAARYIFRGADFVGDPIGDALLFLGGLSLSLFGYRLQDLMTGERK
jgi:hypothetical protein